MCISLYETPLRARSLPFFYGPHLLFAFTCYLMDFQLLKVKPFLDLLRLIRTDSARSLEKTRSRRDPTTPASPSVFTIGFLNI